MQTALIFFPGHGYVGGMRLPVFRLLAAGLSVGVGLSGRAVAETRVPMGNGALLLGQPTVVIEIYTPDDPSTPGTNEYVSFGPEPAMEIFDHRFLLDTGANSILIARDPYAVIYDESNLEQMKARGFQDAEGLYREQGVGGFTDYQVSAAYSLDFVTEVNSTGTLHQVHIMNDDLHTLGDYSGIIGMPAMVGRLVELDMTPWLGVDLANMATRFVTALPADETHRVRVPLRMVDFPQDGQLDPSGPLPAWAPLPFLDVRVATATDAAAGSFLLDTGAQLSMLSAHLAMALGLDSNGDGLLDENDDRYADTLEVGGVGGSIHVPLFELESLSVATREGPRLQWRTGPGLVLDEGSGNLVETNVAVAVLVLEIAESIDGVFGMDLLNSGWMEGALGGTDPGAFEKVWFDFRQTGSPSADLIVDLSPSWDQPETVPDPDRDGDLLPDDWELEHFFTTRTASSETDQDEDGFLDYEEARALTDPRDPDSLLRVNMSILPALDMVVAWPGSTARTYRVEQATDLPGSWTVLQSGIPGVEPLTVITTRPTSASACLRVGVDP